MREPFSLYLCLVLSEAAVSLDYVPCPQVGLGW